ncbi:MAG TPA: peptidase domain-containing ABC transporter [Candidatus Limnocylindrales bacterium]|jgi:ATP-binding cassette subfamily B protein RaxB|nr:peptidase domain-containing ABC transporter [Candidatus Limnocylindrales bacterium]
MSQSQMRGLLRSLLSHSVLPMIFQTEATECGLACLAMVANYHGLQMDLATLRERCSISLRGSTLGQLINFASRLEFSSRPLRIELEDLPYLQTPCILHWDMTHFVVLKRATEKHIVIHDPARGIRKLSYHEASDHFTGVALELTPTPAFAPRKESHQLRLRDLVGRIVGLRGAMVQVAALAVALELFAIVSPLFLQIAVDKAASASRATLLASLGLGFMFLVVLQSFLAGLRSWATLYFGTAIKLQWFANLFSHLLRLPVSFFERRYFGDLISRFDGAEVIQRTLTNNFIEALLDGTVSLFVVVVMFLYSARLGVIVIGGLVIYAAVRAFSYRPLRDRTEEQITRAARQQSHFLETLRGIRTIKVFGREDSRKSNWMNLLVANVNAQVASERLSIFVRSANLLIFGLQTVAVVWAGVVLVQQNRLTVGMLFAFVAYSEQFKLRMITLVDRAFEFRMLSLQADRLSDIAFAKPESLAEASEPVAPFSAGIEVRSLSFRYSESDPWLLREIGLQIRPGECVALTGPSGAGKSTLLKLMAGLLVPEQGDVIIAGHSVCTSRAAVSAKVGFVLQDDSLFAGTVASNIAFSSDVPELDRVRECARLACLEEDIANLPMGYETLIGEMGSALSGGQQQRLLLARALYHQPSILILDEATSHLDVATEQRIAAMLGDLKITRIFAAHRPDTIAIADRVIHLARNGMLTEEHAQPKLGSAMGQYSQHARGELYARSQGD